MVQRDQSRQGILQPRKQCARALYKGMCAQRARVVKRCDLIVNSWQLHMHAAHALAGCSSTCALCTLVRFGLCLCRIEDILMVPPVSGVSPFYAHEGEETVR